jgi:hypothetical protein
MVMIKAPGSETSGTAGAIHTFGNGAAGSLFKLANGAKLLFTTGGAGGGADNATSAIGDYNGTGVTAGATLGAANNPNNQTYITALRQSALPAGSTFAGWSSGAATNSELVGRYAIGGATNSSAASERPVAGVDSNVLSLTAIVRTNDGKLSVVGEAGGSLTNWSTNGVSNAVAGSQAGVPDGCQRQVFSVDRTNSPSRQFLRLKATLAP